MAKNKVVICSKFITFAVTKTTRLSVIINAFVLWFAQNSLPLRWQRQPCWIAQCWIVSCDLLKIHYLCGDKDNVNTILRGYRCVVICSKFITFAVTKTTCVSYEPIYNGLWFAQNSLPLRWQRQPEGAEGEDTGVVICSKFITFAVTKTTLWRFRKIWILLWFAQNSLPLRWQRQLSTSDTFEVTGCDLLKIHYLCGDKDNTR